MYSSVPTMEPAAVAPAGACFMKRPAVSADDPEIPAAFAAPAGEVDRAMPKSMMTAWSSSIMMLAGFKSR